MFLFFHSGSDVKNCLSKDKKKIVKENFKCLLPTFFSCVQNSFKSFSFKFRLTLFQTTNFRTFRTQKICRRQFQIENDGRKIPETGRKHWGKRRSCSLRATSPFPTVFSKDLHLRHVKTRACLVEGLQTNGTWLILASPNGHSFPGFHWDCL